jgi:hypothetical protein
LAIGQQIRFLSNQNKGWLIQNSVDIISVAVCYAKFYFGYKVYAGAICWSKRLCTEKVPTKTDVKNS